MNKNAAFFASVFVAIIALLSSIYVYFIYGINGALITIVGSLVWLGIGYYFKHSKS